MDRRFTGINANQGLQSSAVNQFGTGLVEMQEQKEEQDRGIQGKQASGSQDDQKIIEEIEKTIQGLLNLNIIDSFSESSAEGTGQTNQNSQQTQLQKKDRPGTPKSNMDSSESGKSATNETSAEVTDSVPSEPSQPTSQTQEEQKGIQPDQADKQKYIDDCTALVMQRIQSEGVNDMNHLAVMLRDCLGQFAVAYTDRYGKSQAQSQEEKDNVKLKKAVKILYNRLTVIKLDRLGAQQNILEQNRRLQAQLAAKDRQIQQLQIEQQKMQNLMHILLQQQGINLSQGRGGPDDQNGNTDGDNSFFRGGSVF